MPIGYPPSVFVSSTCYDLSQVRLDLKRFIEGLGYEAVISEHLAFPVNPQVGTVINCVNAVRDRADLFVLIVGDRYGTPVEGGRSVTNLEYLEARAKGIPIYVFVLEPILNTLKVWQNNPKGDFSAIVDDVKVFAFVDEVRRISGHWVYGFKEVADIQTALRYQWALLFTDALAVREQVRGAKLPPELMELPPAALRILLEKRKGWEYRFFSACLRHELNKHEGTRNDLKYGLQIGPITALGDVELMKWLSTHMTRLVRLVNSVSALANVALQEAVGAPGEPGHPELIAYVARRIGSIFAEVLKWTLTFFMLQVDERFSRLLCLVSKFSEDIVQKLRGFPDLIDEELDKADQVVSAGGKCRGELILKLDLKMTDELQRELEHIEKGFAV
jgi:Domain of unknown function (DUF4062)